MKTRIFVTLFLTMIFVAVTVALPAFAQQTSSDSAAQAPAPGNDNVREPLPPPTPRDFWDGDDPNFGSLLLHPFARKAWVKRQVGPIKDRINELDEITSENAAKIKDIDARSQKGLQMASEKTSLADQHATDAANKAQMANLSATGVTTRISSDEQIVGNLDQYKPSTQTEILFRPGQTLLSKQAKDALDQMAAPLKDQHNYVIEVHGFAPGRGQAAITASQKMADSVVRYLVLTHNIPVYRIYTLGMGNTPAPEEAGTKRPAGARVEVSLLKNDVLSAQR